jgi:uncharacterized PurR-regulated membrane protein YhhQ (DUF165 family)
VKPARPLLAVALLSAFIAAVSAANYTTAHLGGPDHMIPVFWFGLAATAGTLFAGACLALRDGLQDAGGRAIVAAGILVGAGISFFTSTPGLALASGIAFGVSEVVDALIYTPIRSRSTFGDRTWTTAVVLSGIAGAILDTILFLWIAGFPIWHSVPGQLIGKTWATLTFLIIGWALASCHAVHLPAVRPARP